MKFILTIVFSFYASLDALILSESKEIESCWKHRLVISSISCFFSVIGYSTGTLLLPSFHQYTPDELVTIALLFVMLYLFHFRTSKFMLISTLILDSQKTQHAAVTGCLMGINNLGFGFLAGLEMLSLFWMMMFTFLFGYLLLNTQKNTQVLTSKAFSIFLLIVMIVLLSN